MGSSWLLFWFPVVMRVITRVEVDASVIPIVTDEEKVKELKLKQFDWLRSKGGFANEKVGVAPPSGYLDPGVGGLYALEDIAKGEDIFLIPENAVFSPPKDEYYHEDRFCDTAQKMVFEYTQKRQESEFWPYLQYVFEAYPHRSIPYAWSKEAKTLVHNILGKNLLDPFDFGQDYPCYLDPYYEEMDFFDEPNKELLDAARRIILSRGWEHVLVPVYDLGNHRNGKWHNMDQLYASNYETFHVVALRDISKGEQLYLSYNQCNDETCAGYDKIYVANSIFLDYGFVEQMPQRWIFTSVPDEEILLLEIDEIEMAHDDANTQRRIQYNVTWISNEPSPQAWKWLEVNHKRLAGMRDWVMYQAERLPASNEGRTAVDFYEAITRAMEQALLVGRSHHTADKNASCDVVSRNDDANV